MVSMPIAKEDSLRTPEKCISMEFPYCSYLVTQVLINKVSQKKQNEKEKTGGSSMVHVQDVVSADL